MKTCVWLICVCLIGFSFHEIASQPGCHQLHSRLQEANKDNLEHVDSKMESTIPQQCIDEVINFSLHEDTLANIHVLEEENAKVAIHEILQQTGQIFRQNHTEISWDEDSIIAFQTGLDQQTQNLGRCLSASPRSRGMQLTRLRVKRYFQKLKDLLKEKEYSQCAWKIVWIQIRQCFLWTIKLIQMISN